LHPRGWKNRRAARPAIAAIEPTTMSQPAEALAELAPVNTAILFIGFC
jgi:hypothetical protein